MRDRQTESIDRVLRSIEFIRLHMNYDVLLK
uniref:Uncharacterized protein n=1 Tax=Anguilla anguilla TaxID=7936 RepID=A0A0E9S5U6_ANGAN